MKSCTCNNYKYLYNEIGSDCEDCLERILYKICFHCAPALTGLKPANMFSLRANCVDDYCHNQAEIERLVPLRCRLFKFDVGKFNLLLYDEQALEIYLYQTDNLKYLRSLGYNTENLNTMLDDLGCRFVRNCPHEVGLFLGYPLSDVIAFKDGDSVCLDIGYWKVYSDLHGAKNTFKRYDRARHNIATLMHNGFRPSGVLKLINSERRISYGCYQNVLDI